MEGRIPPNAGQALFTTRFAWSRPYELFDSLNEAQQHMNGPPNKSAAGDSIQTE